MGERIAWGVLWRRRNALDGYREHLEGDSEHPCGLKLFRSRGAARAYISAHYDYIKSRKDLQREPHGWYVPAPVKVTMAIRYDTP